MKIIGISGSLRKGSHTTQLLSAIAGEMPEDVSLEILPRDLLSAVPAFNEDIEAHAPDAVRLVREKVESADGVIIVTPEYNHSLPGWLKNIIDWCSQPKDSPALAGQDVVVIGTSTGMFGGLWGQADTSKSLGGAGARVVDYELAVPHVDKALDDQGKFQDQELLDQIHGAIKELITASRDA